MKKILFVFALMILSINVMASTAAKEHTVERGETIASIAKKYNVTTEAIIEANPLAKDMFYAGMVLIIPDSGVTESTPISPKGDDVSKSSGIIEPEQSSIDSGTTEQDAESSVEGPGWGYAFEFRYGFLKKTKGMDSSNYTYGVDFEAPYWIKEKNKGVFVSGGLGYNFATYNSYKYERGYHYSASSISHFISIPIKAGYAITGNKKFGVTPYIGVGLNIMVKGKYEQEMTGYDKMKGSIDGCKFAPDFKFGAVIRLGFLNLGAYFSLPFTDDSKALFGKDGHFGVTLGGGF